MEKGIGARMEEMIFSVKEERDPAQLSPLVLAYIGDAVFEIMIRTKVVEKGNRQVNKMHKESTNMVKASAQAELIQRLQPYLTDIEKAIYKRGRNAHSHTMAKNSSMKDYRQATGLEALMGYLYLKHEIKRALELIEIGLGNLADREIKYE